MKTTPLHNDHNVYVLGAGFSRERGVPVVLEFMNAIRDSLPWLESHNRAREAESVARLLTFRKEAAAASERIVIDNENIEDLFSLASSHARSPYADDIAVSIAAAIDYRLSTRSEEMSTCALLPTADSAAQSKYSHWLRDVPGQPHQVRIPAYDVTMAWMLEVLTVRPGSENTIISFNYDPVVEVALARLGVEYSYGFAKQSVNYAPGSPVVPGAPLRLLKLHGSMNWAFPRKKGGGAKLTVYPSYSDVRSGALSPAIVPPTWNKTRTRALSSVWSEAHDAIQSATRIIVIGYSFPLGDSHFKYLLGAALRENISLRRVMVVNPDRDAVFERIQQIFRPELCDSGLVSIKPTWFNAQLSRNEAFEFLGRQTPLR